MELPKYVDRILRTKKQRQFCIEFKEFCFPVFSCFRFLVNEHGFGLHELHRARRECWITFRKRMPIPVRNPKYFETFVDVTIESEAFCSIHGSITLGTEANFYSSIRRFGIAQLVAKHYQSKKTTRHVPWGAPWDEQIAEMRIHAESLHSNWNDVIIRLTRNVPASKLEK